MATTNLGRVAIVPRGTWNAATTYKKLDLVTFEGSSYIALQNNSNKPVSNTTYWQKIAQKGDQGIQGIQGIQGETGNGIASIELTNTSGAVKTYTITYTNGNTTTFQVTDGEVTNEVLAEELEAYALIDGYYEEMTVGAAENLTGKGTGTPAMFTHRTTGGDADVADGIATLNKIKGNTLKWNQYIEIIDKTNSTTHGFAVWDPFSTNTAEKTVSCFYGSRDYTIGVRYQGAPYKLLLKNHKYYIAATMKEFSLTPTNNEWRINANIDFVQAADEVVLNPGTEALQAGKRYSGFFTVYDNDEALDYSGIPRITFKMLHESGELFVENDYWTMEKPILIDLTSMFGAGNEPSTTEEFESLFPLDWYDYNEDTFLNYAATTLRTIGFNQWDEEWEVGAYDVDSGQKTANNDAIRSKNKIKCFPNTTYYFNSQNKWVWLCFFDINQHYIGKQTRKNSAFTTPDNAYYFVFHTVGYGSVYNNDLCINIAWSGYRNGEYEPYWKRDKSLDFSEEFPNGLMNISTFVSSQSLAPFKDYDEITKDKIYKRCFIHTFTGTEAWYPLSDGQGGYISNTYYVQSSSLSTDFPKPIFSRATTNYYYPQKYPSGSGRPTSKHTDNTGQLAFTDDNYTTVEAWKAHLAALYSAGKPLQIIATLFDVYTSTSKVQYEEVINLENPLNLNYIVSDFGTEEIISNVPTAPINADIVYGMNATDTLRRLPENYISKESMEAFLSKLSEVTNGTWSMTYNSETGKYAFTYVANTSGGGE